jgi:tripartite-type tricarboxylate transporter receptor subunit TctC
MPKSVVDRLNEASARAVAQPDYISAMHNAGVHPEPSTPEGLRAIVTRELTKWRNVAKTVKIDF